MNIKHVAKLANLELKNEEIKTFESQLSSILNYIKKLGEVETKNVEPTSQVTGLENVTITDEAKPSLSQEEALANGKDTHNGMFKVKAILDS
ncbi:MAG: Asp-tRNA(Asn)/Glu-tRNA(Gln) amidotransferase subunit GatC [Candidatus Levyibacteriota bacterium]